MFPELFLFFALMINLIYCIYTISKFNKIKYFLKYKSSKVLFLNFYSNINIKRLYIKYFNFSLSYKFLINFLICCFLVTLFYLFNLYTLVVLDLSGGLLYLFDFFIIDLYSQFSKFFISLLFLIILFFFLFFNTSYNNIDFFFLFFCSFITSLFLMSVFDFITMYFLLESLTFITCFLIFCNSSCLFSVESSIKYFLISSVASGLLGFGITWIFFFTKSTKFLEFIKLIFFCSEFPHFFLAVQLIFLSIIVKLGVAPFYFWIPNIYGNLDFLLFFFFITFLKCVYSFLLIKIVFYLFLNFVYFLKFFLSFIIFFSFLIGSVGALEQKKFQYFFVYASLNQFAFFLIGLLCFSLNGIVSSLFFLIQYIFNSCFFFGIIFYLQLHCEKKITSLFNLKGLSIFYFFESTLLSLILFSFIGLPPLIGFIAKFSILVQASSCQLYFEILIALFFNCFSAFYYLNIVKYIWFDKTDKIWWFENLTFYKSNCISFFVNSKNFSYNYNIVDLFGYLNIFNLKKLNLATNTFFKTDVVYNDLSCFNSKLNFFFYFNIFKSMILNKFYFFQKGSLLTISYFFFLGLGYVFNLCSFFLYFFVYYVLKIIVFNSFNYSFENSFI